ncbi:putative membrane protein [Weissella oryzae SG25]|uniref:Putative membrane protein n=2 Tax=Weissella TaxID=46255 RepID=A0A069CY20_WEIOS|nr:putative membrane protein [Weissella oryzae SG25]
MGNNQAIRQKARGLLKKGNYKTMLKFTLAYFVAGVVFSMITEIIAAVLEEALHINGETGFLSGLTGIFLALLMAAWVWATVNWIRTGEQPAKVLPNLFAFYRSGRFIKMFSLMFMQIIYTALWTLLLIVPGIIKGYGYSQAMYLRADALERGQVGDQDRVGAYLKQSSKLMKGHKWQFFVLQLSIAWWLWIPMAIAAVTLITSAIGIVYLIFSNMTGAVDAMMVRIIVAMIVIVVCAVINFFWVQPYLVAAQGAFYVELTKDLPIKQVVKVEVLYPNKTQQ